MKFTKINAEFLGKEREDAVLFYRNILGFRLEMVVPNNKNIVEHTVRLSITKLKD